MLIHRKCSTNAYHPCYVKNKTALSLSYLPLRLSPQLSYHPFWSKTYKEAPTYTASAAFSPETTGIRLPIPTPLESSSHIPSLLYLCPAQAHIRVPCIQTCSSYLTQGVTLLLKHLNVRSHEGSVLWLHWVSVPWKYSARHRCDFKLPGSYPQGVTRNRWD